MWWKSIDVESIVGSHYIDFKYHDNGLNGVVFRALARASRKPVAIKLIRVKSKDQTTRKRLAAEIEAMKRLDGKCSVKICESNLESTPPYYVMEFVRWGNFRSRLSRRISVLRLLSLFQSICCCVAECHAIEVTHRDIKPENILFRSPYQPILGDFGMCKLGATTIGTTRIEMEKRGTPLYMAPEQLKDYLPQSKPADIYALGTMLYFDIMPKLRHSSLKDQAETLTERCRVPAAKKRPTIQEVTQEIEAMVTLTSSLNNKKIEIARLITIVEAFIERMKEEDAELARTEGLYLRQRMLEFNELAEDAGNVYTTSEAWHLEEVPPYYAPNFNSERRDIPIERQKENVLREARRFFSHIKRYRRALL